MILACRMHFEKYILAFRFQSLDCAFLKYHIQFCLSLLKSTSPVLVSRFFSLPWCSMWASLYRWWCWWSTTVEHHVAWKWTQQFPRNTRNQRGSLEPSSPLCLPACAVHPLVFLPSVFSDLCSLFTVSFFSVLSFCAWSSSFYCFLMANPSRFNSTFSLCASWLQFHCQLPNCLPCLCTDITHGCRPHVRVDLPGSGTSCQLGGGTDNGELTSSFWGLPLQRDCGCGGQSYLPGHWKLQ